MAKHLRIMNEWRTIKELPSYEVSSDGRVRRKDRLRELKEKLDRYGYPSVGLYCSETKRKFFRTIHRLVATEWVPNDEGKPQVNHKDGVKTNRDYKNLEWVTVGENIRHSYEHLLNGNTTHIFVKDVASGELRKFKSIKEFGKEIGVFTNVILPLIKNSDRNPILGKYHVSVANPEMLSERSNVKSFGRDVTVYDEVDKSETVYGSINLAAYHTSIRSLSNILKHSGLMRVIGYQISLDKDRIDKTVEVDVEETLKDRERYYLTPYRPRSNSYLVYDYVEKTEYVFENIDDVVEHLNSLEPIHRKVVRDRVSYALADGNISGRNRLVKGYGVATGPGPVEWFPHTEEVILSSRNGLSAPNAFYRVVMDGKSELVIGHHSLCKKLGYGNDKPYRTIDLERVLKFVNIPNLSVTRLNKPMP